MINHPGVVWHTVLQSSQDFGDRQNIMQPAHVESHGQQTRLLTQTQPGRVFEVPLPHKSLKVAPAKALFTQPMFCTGFLMVSVGARAAENRSSKNRRKNVQVNRAVCVEL